METSSSKPDDAFNTSIHGLRGFAAFSVLVYHLYRGAITAGAGHIGNGRNFWPADAFHTQLAPVLDTLNAGIEIFFMISGYLITSTLIRHQHVRRFLFNRVVRIYPVFLATQVLMFTLGPIVGWSWMKSLSIEQYFGHLVANVCLLPGVFDLPAALPAAWTLSYEALFYAVSAVVFLSAKRLRPSLVVGGLLICAVLVGAYYPRALYFFVGTAVYFFHRRLRGRDLQPPTIGVLSVVWFIGLHYLLGRDFDVSNRSAYALITPVGFLLFNDIVLGAGPIAWLLRTRSFQFLGTVSYSLYLWQVPVMFVVKRLLLKQISPDNPTVTFYAFSIVSIAASIAVAYISYRIFEVAAPRYLRQKFSKPATP